MKAVILAGGAGTRLWPISRVSRPKQFVDLVGDEPLIKDTYRRLLRMFPSEKIYFSISPSYECFIKDIFPDVDDKNILIEPEKRDTGPAMGFVAAVLGVDDPEEPIVFIPSDHYIGDEEIFLRSLSVGNSLILSTGKLLDIAITPTFPSTVLGYTKISDKHNEIDDIEIYGFKSHHEKPDYETAKKYLDDGSYLWHASYYMWTPQKFLEAYDKYSPEMGSVLREIQKEYKKGGDISGLYSQLTKISFDYAVTENMNPEDVLIIKGSFGWSDIGAWDTLHDRLSVDSNNVTKGECALVDTNSSLIYGFNKNKLIAVVGMEDVVIVDSEDALLVCSKNSSQNLKGLISHLKKNNLDSLL